MDTKTLESEFVEIHPRNSYLSAQKLIAHRHTEFEPPSGGLKRTQNEGTASELEELKRAHEYLRAQLSVPRIERLGGRALAIWNEEQQVAEVIRKDGKFENFGYSEQGKLYLEYYEAMLLLEVNLPFRDVCNWNTAVW
ncbi:tRNA-splicing endonuclease subunit Sen54 isoform X2 [Drosophila teissieri]|uniref:tRNA-splicing endonuclease subunit Sen54 isoform X2 n=1 Tax=Drosophila teissieri TaxID=7243 RepID=UPI001CB9F422|nr:tRNA-splicing endonuclease subunit Sen54 isoform X2 [Drosophila teissieri]